MAPFNSVTGIAAPMVRDDVDTDAVIPVPWMKAISPDYARALFANWRWVDGDGQRERPEFVLNQEPFRRACILVAGSNFGCGSSREAAVWALQGFGIRCVIAAGFSDIFLGNSYRSGLLPIVLPKSTVKEFQDALTAGVGGCAMTVDLQSETITAPDGSVHRFEIDPTRRLAFLGGLDEIGETLLNRADIDAFQRRDREARPWIYEPPLNRKNPSPGAAP